MRKIVLSKQVNLKNEETPVNQEGAGVLKHMCKVSCKIAVDFLKYHEDYILVRKKFSGTKWLILTQPFFWF